MTQKKRLTSEQLRDLVVRLLDDKKALDIKVVDVRGKSALTDFMIIASGTSGRHVASLGQIIRAEFHKKISGPLSIEGYTEGEWVLLDLKDVIIHLFKPDVREHYDLEKLWQEGEKNISETRAPSSQNPS